MKYVLDLKTLREKTFTIFGPSKLFAYLCKIYSKNPIWKN